MCTALSFSTKDHYFGRNLDINLSYGEEVCIIPRHFPFNFREVGELNTHYAIIGMATVVDNVPLLYDASNEFGLSMAGLNFPGNAYYGSSENDKDNISPFEFIPWILGKCETVDEARLLLNRINLVGIPFSKDLPLAPLHWMISDRNKSIVVEAMCDGLHIYDNTVGVLTNNPPFDYQIFNLNNYRHLRNDSGENQLSDSFNLNIYSQGLGALGLPGDVSSMSRFIRMVFGSQNSVCENDENSSVSQFFHLLSSVEMVRGCCRTDNETWDITLYSSCINTDRGLYYYTTYENRQINCVNMHHKDLESDVIDRFPLITNQHINYQNQV